MKSQAAFEALKSDIREGRMNQAAETLFGASLSWGETLQQLYRTGDREALEAHDPLTQFFVTRFRGMPTPAEIGNAPPGAVFLMAFTAFPYLDALLDELILGRAEGEDEHGNALFARILAGEDEGTSLAANQASGTWRFDLMPLYTAKVRALSDFIAEAYLGNFDDFLWRYVADHDLAFDLEQAWRPLGDLS